MINFRQVNGLNRDYQVYNYKTVDFKPKNIAASDVVSFSGNKNNELLRKYGINPAEVQVVSKTCDTNLSTKEKKELLIKVLEAHEQALKNRQLGNFSDRQFATNIKLANGQWTTATNIENNSDEIGLCGERSSIVVAWNKALQFMKLKNLQNEADIKKARNSLNVEYLAMSNYKTPGTDPSAGKPCSECLAWLNEDRYFKANTKVVTIDPDPKTQEPILAIKIISELLPYRSERTSVADKKKVNEMEVNFSQRAQETLKENKISEKEIKELVDAAKQAHDSNKFTALSEKNTASAVLMNNKEIVSGKKFDWTRRWLTSPDLFAVMKAFDKFGDKKEDLKVDAIAYYGKQDVPNIGSLGRISQDRGDANTLVVTIQNDTIQARTILDYIPKLHISSKLKK